MATVERNVEKGLRDYLAARAALSGLPWHEGANDGRLSGQAERIPAPAGLVEFQASDPDPEFPEDVEAPAVRLAVALEWIPEETAQATADTWAENITSAFRDSAAIAAAIAAAFPETHVHDVELGNFSTSSPDGRRLRREWSVTVTAEDLENPAPPGS